MRRRGQKKGSPTEVGGKARVKSLTKDNSVLIEPEVVTSANILGQRKELKDYS